MRQPAWQWPEDLAARPAEATGHSDHRTCAADAAQGQSEPSYNSTPRPTKHYPSRTCRICLETVPPTYHPFPVTLPDFLQSAPRVTYESPDPALGRLLRPCKCKGSSRYVHEGCLRSWRHADPDYGRRNYWQCPTCGFQYRLERMRWGRWISSPLTQIGLTLMILLFAMFLLGFVADPIINLYVDPYDTISSAQFWGPNTVREVPVSSNKPVSWLEHFIKGLASLGVLSFLKVLFALSPWQWWNLRNSGLVGGGRRTTASGRDRVTAISWIVVVIGVGTFLWVSHHFRRSYIPFSDRKSQGVYKGVRSWSRRVLEKAGERVMDVQLDDDDEDEEVEETPPTPDQSSSMKED